MTDLLGKTAGIANDASETSIPMNHDGQAQVTPPPAAVPLSQAPQHVQLAVDLIYLLEQHQLPPDVVLQALQLVARDFSRKAAAL